MLKCINYIIKADKTQSIASLKIQLFAQLFASGVVCHETKGIFNVIKLVNNTHDTSKNNSTFKWSLVLRNNKISKFQPIQMGIKGQNTITGSSKINDQLKSLTEIVGGHTVWQEDTVPKWQPRNKAINSLLKLYRSTLVKCRYTSLELAVRSVALTADPIANFHTNKPVKFGSSNQNQERCL